MHLDDLETKTLFHCVDYTLTQRALAGRASPAVLVALRARLLGEVRSCTPRDTAGADVIGTSEAAAILHRSTSEVRRIADRLGGVHISGAWCFSRAAVEEYARNPPPRKYTKHARTH